MEEKIQELVSIVIPVHNSEKYLSECLFGFVQQTYQNIEVILVDDGSTDKSGEICEQYCRDNNNFHYIRQESCGVSTARNVGLAKAKGKYVVFSDSDDLVKENYIETLAENMNGYDMAVCGYYKVNSTFDVIESSVHGERTASEIPLNMLLEIIFDSQICGYQGFVWNKIFRMDLIRENHLEFDPEIRYNEDRLFVVEYLMNCKKIFYGNEPLYIYVQHPESAMGKINKGYTHFMLSEIDAYDKMLNLVVKYADDVYGFALLDEYYAVERLYKIAEGTDKSYLKNKKKKLSRSIQKEKSISKKKRIKILIKMFME